MLQTRITPNNTNQDKLSLIKEVSLNPNLTINLICFDCTFWTAIVSS